MGLDTTIFFQADSYFSEEHLENNMPSGFSIRPIPEYYSDEYPDATHELDTGYRYYGEGYERGPWPHIAGALMVLFASPCVKRVWYGHDCGRVAEIKPDYVLGLSAYYMRNGGRPYRQCFQAMPVPSISSTHEA